MRRYLALALASVLAAISASVLAMGLGEVNLNSNLNQRLDAEIELVAAAANELESLEVGLASSEAFERYGLPRPAVLGSLEFRVVRRPNGTAYVAVTSTEPVREPFLTFLVEADWSSGRVLREYTLLLDPPTFAMDAQAEPAEAEAPVVTPAPAREPETIVPTPSEPVAGEPRVAETTPEAGTETVTGDVIDIPSLDEEPSPRPIPGPAVTPDMGETYGPIQRNETLWGIAQRLRPDESITINQVMVALYRANPEAFQGNINRLKAGYILRIPEFSEMSAISRGEAFREVKRQNEEWRRGSRPAPAAPADVAPVIEAEPELSLIAPEESPEESASSDAGLGADATTDTVSGAGEFGADTGLADDSLAEPAGEAGADLVEDPAMATESPERLLDIEDESLQAMQEQEDLLAEGEALEPPPLPQAEGEPAAVEPLATDTATEETASAASDAETEPATSPIVPTPAPAEPGLVEKLKNLVMSPLGLGLGAALLVLVLAAALVVRKRREAMQAKATAALAEWEDVGEPDGDDATVIAAGDDDEGEADSVFAHGMAHEDTGTTRLEDDAEATQLLEDADKTQLLGAAGEGDAPAAGDDDFADTVFGGQAVTLDDNDPLSEADFHMAYGLYDQAAEVVEKAVQREPTRKDYLAKLAEIHFAANNTDGFLEAAGKLHALAGAGDADWDNIAIMGRQIAPDNELFAEAGGAAATSVDLDFGSADEEFSGDETVAGISTSAAEESPAEAPAADTDDSLDFDISLDSGEEPAEASEAEDTAPADDAGALDLDALAETDDAAGGEDAGTGLEFDLDIGAADEPAEERAAEENTASDFDLDLGGLDDSADDEEPAEPAAELPDDLALDADADGYSDENTQTEFDKALEELSAFVDTNVPENDAGDATSDAGDSGLSLDDYSFDQDDAAEPADYASEGTGEDEEDIGEIGTKLDLARAYIDMGDPDGARGILEEVVADGDNEQQKEARELLDQLA